MSDDGLPRRTLKTAFLLGAFFTVVFAMRGQFSIAAGVAAGTALGLFSLASLILTIPRLFRSPDPSAKPALALVALFKLPIYAVAIWFIVGSRFVNPLAVVAGVALIPAVLALKVVGHQMLEKSNEHAGDEVCLS